MQGGLYDVKLMTAVLFSGKSLRMFHPEDRGTGIFRRVQRQRVTTKKTGRLGLFNDTES